MTTVERTVERIGQELQEATEAERKLSEEIAGNREALRAASDEKEALKEAAASGKGLRDSPFLKIRRRAEELPALLWAASLRRLELRLGYHTVRAEEADREKKAAAGEVHALEQERHRLQERLNDAVATLQTANADWHESAAEAGRMRRELQALEARGPAGIDALRTSTLRPRP